MPDEALVHGTCVALDDAGVLILGAPGAGKSDLALRLIDQPGLGLSGRLRTALLVADDQVVIRRDGGLLIASAPPAIAGKLEVRGLGIATVATRGPVRLVLAVRLTDSSTIERLPDLGKSRYEVLGLGLPLALIDPGKASAPARLRAALDWLGYA